MNKLNEIADIHSSIQELSIDISTTTQDLNNLDDIYRERIAELEDDMPTWISVEDELPDHLETVWISNGRGWTTLGCRAVYDYEGNWCWAESNGVIYESEGKIVAECESEDLDVRFWQKLPKPPEE